MGSEKVRSAPFGGFPPECIESQRRFGTRVARLYPLLYRDGHNAGAVRTSRGIATLHQAFAGRCLIEYMAERQTVPGYTRNAPAVMREVAVEEVWPS